MMAQRELISAVITLFLLLCSAASGSPFWEFSGQALQATSRQFSEESRRAADSICYNDLGCFTIGEGPLGHIPLLPEDPAELNHQFEFWTQSHLDAPVLLPAEGISQAAITAANILNVTLPLIVIAHGFADNGYEPWMLGIKDWYLKKENTVLIIDWRRGADVTSYAMAARNTELVGRQLGNALKASVALGVPQTNIHLIGHGLGAQVINFAVGWVRVETADFSPARISGLDPAGPLFCDDPGYGNDTFLEESDAVFVDITHTNMGQPAHGHVGCEGNLGHVDFYPNGGYTQPGCPGTVIGTIEGIFADEEDTKTCSHRRATLLFLESLTRSSKAYPCPNLDNYEDDFLKGDCLSCAASETGCSYLGYPSNGQTGRGPLYLLTFSQEEPDGVATFGGYMIRVSVTSSQNQTDAETHGQFSITIQDPSYIHGPYALTEEDENIKQGQVTSRTVLSRYNTAATWDFVQATFEYKAYQGGTFQDGKPSWFIDRIEVDFDNAKKFYHCRSMGEFDSHRPQEIALSTALC